MRDKPPGSNAASENGAYFFVQRLSPPAKVVVSDLQGGKPSPRSSEAIAEQSAPAHETPMSSIPNRGTGVGRMPSDAGGAVALEAAKRRTAMGNSP